MGLSAADIPRLGKNAQAQIAAKIATDHLREVTKKNKYGNTKAVVDGIKFDSTKEANRYIELMSLWRAEKIRDLKLQPQYTLQESYITPQGERVRAIRYVADFSYERPAFPASTGHVYWLRVVEDVKGGEATKTEKYKIKRKLFAEKYGFEITEV